MFKKGTLSILSILCSTCISLLIREEHGIHCAINLLPLQLWNHKLSCLVPWQNDISVTSHRHQYEILVAVVTDISRN